MKKIAILISTVFLVLIVVSCTPTIKNDKYTVTFDSKGGSTVEQMTVDEGGLITKPLDPIKDDYIFRYWYLTSEATAFSFDTPITSNITLKAAWDMVAPPEEVKSITDLIHEDIEAINKQLYHTHYDLSLLTKGPVNNSAVTWISNNKYVSTAGIILPLVGEDVGDAITIRGRFVLDGVVVLHDFDIELYESKEVVLTEKRTVPFENLTEEYDVEDSEIEIFYETNGSVPYVRVKDFMNLLTGFIDPNIEITYETTGSELFIQYFYYDEEEDYTYDLNVTIDAETNTLVAPDPGFYWAYVYSTATNYSRNIYYDRNNPDAYNSEGLDVIYDLGMYNMDIVLYKNEVVLPYYIMNQLFAGSSYYNVYYNHDGLYGVYALPSQGEEAYSVIRESTKNNTLVPADLSIHTFNFLAFSLDYYYGLKEVRAVESYYDILFTKKEGLLTRSATRLDTTINDILTNNIDEPHTSYGYPGYYNRENYHGPTISSLSDFGPRVNKWYTDGLYATDTQIGLKWNITGTNWNASSDKRKLYWFLDEHKTSAVLSLDGFNTADIIEDNIWNEATVKDILKAEQQLFPQLTGGNKYFYYNQSNKQDNILEVLVKGLLKADLNTYNDRLVSEGFTRSLQGLYVKETNEAIYYAQTLYDETYEVFSLSMSVFEKTKVHQPFFSSNIFDLINSDSAVYMEFQLALITKEAPNLKHIILDLTWNTGGNVGALYRVVGFITEAPFEVSSISADTKTESTSFIYIDNVPSYSHLNWALLTTPTTFSAANSLATIFSQNNFGPIIGVTSGGGTSSITPILLPNGTAFTMSSNNMSAYRIKNEDGTYVYVPNELGIEPTHPINMSKIYNNIVLLGALDSYYGS